MATQKVKTVRALERGLDVLVEVQKNQAISLRDLHSKLELPKATLLRMLVTLTKHGLIWKRLADGTYHPSSISVTRPDPDITNRFAEIASPFMERLIKEVNLPSVIAVPRFDHMAIIETNSPLHHSDSTVLGPVGVKLSYIHTATGRAYLAECSASERDAIIEHIRPPNATKAEEDELRAILTDVRVRGYSLRDPAHCWFDRNKQTVLRDGRWSMAVAVKLHGQPVASLNITCSSKGVQSNEAIARNLGPVLQTARDIGQALENIEK